VYTAPISVGRFPVTTAVYSPITVGTTSPPSGFDSFGFAPLAISGHVWDDVNDDGLQAPAGEPGIPGV